MQIRKTLKPGEPGTKGHMKRFGKKLICVRYRYDDVKRVQIYNCRAES